MVRNPLKKEPPEEELPVMPQPQQKEPTSQNMQIVERPITLELINDKINYLTGVIHKIAEAAEIQL